MVSGCIGAFDGGEESDRVTVGDINREDVQGIDGQTFVTPLPGDVHPDDVTFLGSGPFPFVIDIGQKFWHPFHEIPKIMNEPGMWGPWMNEGVTDDTLHFGCYEDISISDDEITVDIRSDQTWANGDTVTAQDVFTQMIAHRMNIGVKPVYEVLEGEFEPTENFTIAAITDFEMSEKSITFVSEPGFFEGYDKQTLYQLALTPENLNTSCYHSNTNVGFNEPWADAIWEHWQKARAGEVDPWRNLEEAVVEPAKEAINADTDEAMNHHRDPDVVSIGHGAWTLKEFEGSQAIVLEPNEHYRHADLINFDEIRYEFDREQRASWAAIQANEIDYYIHEMPEDVASQLPSTHELLLDEAARGIGLQFQHTSPLFDDVRSRRAFLHLLDTEELVKTESDRFNQPIKTPGGDLWGAEEFFEQEFLDSLRTYDHDPERATQLFEDAGWSKEGGEWYLPNGDRAQLELPTGRDTPRYEVTFANQLKDFGIEASVQVQDGGVLTKNILEGNHVIHSQWDLFTGPVASLQQSWMETVAQGMYIKNAMRGLFPVEVAEEFEFQEHPIYGEGMAQPKPSEESLVELHKVWEIEAPPVGEWDGELQTYHPVSLAREIYNEETLRQNAPKLAWLVNWYVPAFPLMNSFSQTTINTANWIWPGEGTSVWHDDGRYLDHDNLVSMTGRLFYGNWNNPRV